MGKRGWGAATALLLGLATGGGIVAAAGQDAATAEPPTPLGYWISENVMEYDGLDLSAAISDDELEALMMDEIVSYAFLPDGTWIVHAEDPLGVGCYHAVWHWVADGDTLRVPGRPDLRFHFNLDYKLLMLTSPVGNLGVFLAQDAPPDTVGCTPDPEMLPFW
ncbi:MAG: hypothetical protein IPK64_04160 [bacterium]|nr:hypothetical protein [bacterium]